ncbi:immunity 51 family protein [Endozoicomonas sp. SM1973]|uniref:Immunity 51 family protein n=1 Tax=Spartinivicinus marinus TaxID=2994442 RepID=A0A853IEK1_9GAMM|nr:immunity 51 family protein [Spartinivicinus marinus]MCX4026027.1 immunity 51 family protein [Spartinivicinus marinus]NYZ67927.1 immunity 51 family protein [Spartinivicinus marinus]
MNFKETIKPFFWNEYSNSFSLCLNVGEYKNELFQKRSDEGFEGNGYDWASLARVFLMEKKPLLEETIKFDPEGSMFCAYSSKKEALKEFAISFKSACENDTLIHDLFLKAELD